MIVKTPPGMQVPSHISNCCLTISSRQTKHLVLFTTTQLVIGGSHAGGSFMHGHSFGPPTWPMQKASHRTSIISRVSCLEGKNATLHSLDRYIYRRYRRMVFRIPWIHSIYIVNRIILYKDMLCCQHPLLSPCPCRIYTITARSLRSS